MATLSYYNGTKTVANWIVRPLQEQKKAKNVILFIGMYNYFPIIADAKFENRRWDDHEYDHSS